MPRHHWHAAAVVAALTLFATPLPAGQATGIPDSMFAPMRWRNIGPLRGSRTCAVSGHRSHPYTFYIGVCNGGVWKTTDAGTTWTPIFDDQPTQSIGAIAVAPSDPNIIYVGSGEGLHRPDLSIGDGMYRSSDAGRTWTHLGLRDAQQIAAIEVDPSNPNRLFVAVVGHPYGPSAERGVYRSTDGGRTFTNVLSRGENVGARDVDLDPSNPNIVYASLWEAREGPWENAAWSGPANGLFKSTDGGATWRQLTNGLPDTLQHAELAIAPSQPQRLYAIVAAGGGGRGGGGAGGGGAFYRSDDGGETWTKPTTDNRAGNQRVSESNPFVDPTNPDRVYVTDVVSFRSLDGGRTWAPFQGAPGGEDYQGYWFNPDNPDIMISIADQGAVVSLNGGDTWTTWFNQPTAQLYHVAADANFPYRLCSGQQETGSACVATRGDYGAISIRDWLPVGIDEYAYAAPDPLNPHFVYGGRNVTRFDYRSGQTANVGPVGRGGGANPDNLSFRQVRTQPVVFSEADKRMLLFGNNYLWKTLDGGLNWTRISDDLTRKSHQAPASIGAYSDQAQNQLDTNSARVIYAIGPSPIDANRIWIGTDDSVVATTADGGRTWSDVSPPQLGPYWKIFTIDAGRFDTRTAYVAANTLRVDEQRPYIYRTHDAGLTWTPIVTGMEDAGAANAVREDPQRRGLLYASTEKGVYVSFDDGDHWQSLRLNLPATSVRDLIVKDDDVAVATHGRGFWVLDDVTPLRQMDGSTASKDVVLFKPALAWRVRWNLSDDMPWPKDEPTLPNPPEGTAINYYLRQASSRPVTLEVTTAAGRLIRRYSSTDELTPVPDEASASVPIHWYRPPHPLETSAGMHRFYWDIRYQPADGAGGGGPSIGAIPYNSAPAPSTPLVAPGTYIVTLIVDGQRYSQPIEVRQDPRVQTAAADMQQVYTLTSAVYSGAMDAREAIDRAGGLRSQVAERLPQTTGATRAALEAFDKKIEAIAGAVTAGGRGGRGFGGRGGRGGGQAQPPDTLAAVAASLGGLVNSLGAADAPATANQVNAINAAQAAAGPVMARWRTIVTTDLTAVNSSLQAAGLLPLK